MKREIFLPIVCVFLLCFLSSLEASVKKTKASNNKKAAKAEVSEKKVKTKNLKVEKTQRKERIKEPILKVKLGSGSYGEVNVSFPEGGQINNSKHRRIKNLKRRGVFSWTSKTQKNKKVEYLNETLYFKPNKELFTFNGIEYRGQLRIKFLKNGAIAINEVKIEDYLRGVVGSEMGALSPDESLKAQTVIARTYAYANRGRHGSDEADVCSTTHCQVYLGKKSEHNSVDKAIKNTKGYILTHRGKPISALYHATCGGMTSDNDKVFGGAPQPYLRRVPCPFCKNGSKYRWDREISVSELKSALNNDGIRLGEILDLSIEAPEAMDRVSYIVFNTRGGEEKIKGTTIRRVLNLPSTTFILSENKKEAEKPTINGKVKSGVAITGIFNEKNPPRQLILYCAKGLIRSRIPKEGWKCISHDPMGKNSSSGLLTKISLFGRGFGHQVGLCQSGAIEMGKRNWNYRQILAHYYQEVALKNLGY